jgi:hypothetical protein
VLVVVIAWEAEMEDWTADEELKALDTWLLFEAAAEETLAEALDA